MIDIEARDVLTKARIQALSAQVSTARPASAICTTMLSILFVSTEGVGWTWTSVWVIAMIMAFVFRNWLVRRLLANQIMSDRVENGIALSSASLGIVINAPAAFFMPQMTDIVSGLYVGLMMSWLAVAVVIIGIHVRSYVFYVVTGMTYLVIGYWQMLPTPYAAAGTLGIIAASVMLISFSKHVASVFDESVLIRRERDGLVQQLTLSIADVTDAQNQRSRFLAATAHDLLQPVHALMLLSGVLQDSRSEQERHQAMKGIQSTTASIDSMFRGLLDLARLDQGAVLPSLTNVRLSMVLQGIESAYKNVCEQKDIALSVVCSRQIMVRADATLLDRTIRNLVDNAVKFTPSGKITVSAKTVDQGVSIRIIDTGMGVEEEQLATIFDVFYRAPATVSQSIQGIGLGLSVAKQVTELMGGNLTLQSKVNAGTTVELILAAGSDINSIGKKTIKSGLALPKQMLIIEDDQAARSALRLWLLNLGITVISAESLDDALQQLEVDNFIPEHALVDYQLGLGLNGIDAITTLKSLYPSIKASLITGSVLGVDQVAADITVLAKPLNPDRLHETISYVEDATD